jgi:hypothetical protein
VVFYWDPEGVGWISLKILFPISSVSTEINMENTLEPGSLAEGVEISWELDTQMWHDYNIQRGPKYVYTLQRTKYLLE